MAKEEREKFLKEALEKEAKQLEEYYRWLQNHMPPAIYKEISQEDLMMIAHSLINFDLQDYETQIDLKGRAIAIRLDSADADLKILKNYRMYGIKKYRAFVSDVPPPISRIRSNLRIAVIVFSEIGEKELTKAQREEIRDIIREKELTINDKEFDQLIDDINPRFLLSLTKERLITAIKLYFQARDNDACQYEVRYNKDWQENRDIPSLQIVLAWSNVPKRHFIYRIAKTIYRHGLVMKKVNAAYIKPHSSNSVLIMSLGLHGQNGNAAWEESDIDDLLKEILTVKYFEGYEAIDDLFVDKGLLSGNLSNFIKCSIDFIHQMLVHADLNMYAPMYIEEALCRHPELTEQLAKAFELKFHPEKNDIEQFNQIKEEFLSAVDRLDTGHEINDMRRKNILFQGMNFINHTLKTNFYRNNKTSYCFRLDPNFMNYLPYDRQEKFPELPYSVFFSKGMFFIGFHIRFKDLSRGGLRTVIPRGMEQMIVERNNVFSECYALSFTQQRKNKDIPEGGSKAVIFLEPYEKRYSEADIYRKELEKADVKEKEIEKRIEEYHKEQKLEHLYHAQRSFIESFLVLVNCEPDGKLRTKNIVDYWKKPEYIYLGPDENMHNVMIDWMAEYSKNHHYAPGASFITSKPSTGINHKEYGVTSLSVNVYMEEVLLFLGIDPKVDPFTIKISGGPDGDVAGNLILNLYRYYPKTAKLLALTDVSGTIYDPEGLDLKAMKTLFEEGKPICNYPAKKLNEGGFLLDLQTKREIDPYTQQSLCWRREKGRLIEEWLSGNEMNTLFRHNLNQVHTDVFVPAGGRPRTLNANNWREYLDETGQPTSRAIVEGANLYLTPTARHELENLGVILIKDSSANKGGVICSSLEVLIGLTITSEQFLAEKPEFMEEILATIRRMAKNEAQLLLKTHAENHEFLSDISEMISDRINTFTYQIYDFLQSISLSNDPNDPLIRCLLNYCLPLLRTKYQENILNIPDIHKKAIIACHLASQVVYKRGLDWHPTIVDVLPLIANDQEIISND